MKIEYSLLNPSKNRTILVTSPVSTADRAFAAQRLLEYEPAAEQVGFVHTEGDIAYLDMAGGEFCGNAVRCTGFLTGKKKVVCVSQMIACDGTLAAIPKEMKGIRHYIFEEMIETPEEEIRKHKEADAIGFMFLNEREMSLRPLVYVPAIHTLYWENSCASGSVAAAKYLCEKYGREIDVDLHQPGGNLHVKTNPDMDVVFLDGTIDLEKKGILCIPERSS